MPVVNTGRNFLPLGDPGLKIYFTGPSDKMSDDVEFGSDICPMTFSSVLTQTKDVGQSYNSVGHKYTYNKSDKQ